MSDWAWKLILVLSHWDTPERPVENQSNPKHTAAGEEKLDGSQWVNYKLEIETHMFASCCWNWVWKKWLAKSRFHEVWDSPEWWWKMEINILMLECWSKKALSTAASRPFCVCRLGKFRFKLQVSFDKIIAESKWWLFTFWILAERRSGQRRAGPSLYSTLVGSGHLELSWPADCCPCQTSLQKKRETKKKKEANLDGVALVGCAEHDVTVMLRLLSVHCCCCKYCTNSESTKSNMK